MKTWEEMNEMKRENKKKKEKKELTEEQEERISDPAKPTLKRKLTREVDGALLKSDVSKLRDEEKPQDEKNDDDKRNREIEGRHHCTAWSRALVACELSVYNPRVRPHERTGRCMSEADRQTDRRGQKPSREGEG